MSSRKGFQLPPSRRGRAAPSVESIRPPGAPAFGSDKGIESNKALFVEARSENEKANEKRAQLRARVGIIEGVVEGISTQFVDLRKEYPGAVIIDRKREKETTTRNATQRADNTAGTVYDRRMGPLNGFQNCMTCHQGIDNCPTHAGLILIPPEAYFMNPLALKYAYQVLQSVCNTCGHLLVKKENLRAMHIDQVQNTEQRLELISKECIGVLCTHSIEARARIQKETGRVGVFTPCVENPIFVESVKQNHGQIVYTFKKAPSKRKKAAVDEEEENDEAPSKKESPDEDEGEVSEKRSMKKDFVVMSISKVEEIFDSIPERDLATLGFVGDSHPRNYIMREVSVLPPKSRLDQNNDGKIRDDPIGKLYEKILDNKDTIAKKKEELERARDNQRRLLMGAGRRSRAGETLTPAELEREIDDSPSVSKIRNDIAKAGEEVRKNYNAITYGPETPVTSKWVHQGLKKGLQNKEGHMRGAMMSKRVDDAGRTVGSTGSDILLGEVGVPSKFRSELTVDEPVFEGNLEYAKKLVLDGEVIRVDLHRKGVEICLKVTETNMVAVANKIRLGDVVNRRIRDGDLVMLNRQPTIHKQSIFVLRVRLTNLDTIQLSLPHADALKGDFDGDEYTIHVIQSVEARAISLVLQNSYACMANEQNNFTMMFPTFEAPLQAFKLTRRLEVLPEDTWNLLARYITPKFDEEDFARRLAYNNVPRYSGAALMSATLPADFNFVKKDSSDPDNTVDVDMGILKRGYLNKGMIGPGHSITNAIRLKYGDARAAHFTNSATLVLQFYGIVDPTSLGIDDCYYDIESVRETKKRKIYEAEVQQNSSGYRKQSVLERKIEDSEMVTITDNLKAEGSKDMMKAIPDNNQFIYIAMSGAKGNRNNVYQILVSGGQQFYKGERMPLDYTYNSRSLATFVEGDSRLMARGLVIHSFSEGLTPQELFFLQKAGRKNLTDTSQTTFIPGMIRRELTNMLSDIVVTYDGSVRTSSGEIVQLNYNGDGFSAGKVYKRSFEGFRAAYFTDTKATVRDLNRAYEYSIRSGV